MKTTVSLTDSLDEMTVDKQNPDRRCKSSSELSNVALSDYLFFSNLPKHFWSTFSNWNRPYWLRLQLITAIGYSMYYTLSFLLLTDPPSQNRIHLFGSAFPSAVLLGVVIALITSVLLKIPMLARYSHSIVSMSTLLLISLEAFSWSERPLGSEVADTRLCLTMLLVHLFINCRLFPATALAIGVVMLGVSCAYYVTGNREVSFRDRLPVVVGMLFHSFTLYIGLVSCGGAFAWQEGLAGAVQDHLRKTGRLDLLENRQSNSLPHHDSTLSLWGVCEWVSAYLAKHWSRPIVPAFSGEREIRFRKWLDSRRRQWLSLNLHIFLAGQVILFAAIIAMTTTGDNQEYLSRISQWVQLVSAFLALFGCLIVSRARKYTSLVALGGVATILAFGFFAAAYSYSLRASEGRAGGVGAGGSAFRHPIVSPLDPFVFTILATHATVDNYRLASLLNVLACCGAVFSSYLWLEESLLATAMGGLQMLVVVASCAVLRMSVSNAARMRFVLEEVASGDSKMSTPKHPVAPLSIAVLGWQRAMVSDRTLYYLKGKWMNEEHRFQLISSKCIRERLAHLDVSVVIDEAFDNLGIMSIGVCDSMCQRLERLLNRIVYDSFSAQAEHSACMLFDVLFPTCIPPSLQICVQSVGSRGDVQPFVYLARELANQGHTVRLATHSKFKAFVEQAGVEFYPLAEECREDHWQPETLMKYAERNPGMGPDLLLRPKALFEMLSSAPDMQATLHTVLLPPGVAEKGKFGPWMACVDSGRSPFVCEAIIANPPSYAHTHLAEKMGIPLQMVFTMPWTSTSAVGHPLAVSNSSVPSFWKRLSYRYMEFIQWRGISAGVNHFRSVLGLQLLGSGDGAASRLEKWKVPFTYCFSEALLPKPSDWGPYINVTGFILGDSSNTPYTPPEQLAEFLSNGPKPFYAGFGSITADLTELYRSLLRACSRFPNNKFIVQKGWCDLSGLRQDEFPENVLLICPTNSVWEQSIETALKGRIVFADSIPHDWLFDQCSGVMHHGGAGTVAAGLAKGLPTIVCAFFGDQPVWGQMVESHGCGRALLARDVNEDSIYEALSFSFSSKALSNAQEMADKLKDERKQGAGAVRAVKAFHEQLPLELVACEVCMHQISSNLIKGNQSSQRPRAAARFSHTFDLRLCYQCAAAVGDTNETALRVLDWGHAQHKGLLWRYIFRSIKELNKLSKRPRQGFESSGILGFLMGCILAVFEVIGAVCLLPFFVLRGVYREIYKRKESHLLLPDLFKRLSNNDEPHRLAVRDATLEILTLRAKIETSQKAVSELFRRDPLFHNKVH